MSNSEDCRIGKELKQSTCRYVKECKRGWTRNDKFICRKTNRRLVSPKKFTTPDPSKSKRASRKVDSEVDFDFESVPKKFTSTNPEKVKSVSKKSFTSAKPGKSKTSKLSAIEEGNEFSPLASSRSTPNKTFTKLKSASKAKSKKYKVGNTFMYTHPDGRKEKATVTRLGENDRLELHIPSLANNWANYGAPKFKKNQKVFFIYKSGMKEQAIVKKVYDGEYDVYLNTQQRIKRVKENQIKAMSDYKQIDEFPYYVLKSA
jgi:hypothetical protein